MSKYGALKRFLDDWILPGKRSLPFGREPPRRVGQILKAVGMLAIGFLSVNGAIGLWVATTSGQTMFFQCHRPPELVTFADRPGAFGFVVALHCFFLVGPFILITAGVLERRRERIARERALNQAMSGESGSRPIARHWGER